MPDFTQLIRGKAVGDAKRPPRLPMGDYQGVVKSYEYGDSNKNKTPYVRFHLIPTAFPADCPPAWPQVDKDGTTTQVSQSDFDLSKRQMRRDFYLTEDALWRLDEFLKSMNLSGDLESAIPQTVGGSVVIEVQQYVNEQSGDIGNQVGRLVGA